MTSLILQTAFHQSPINRAIFLWWWALWTVFEVFVLFDLFSSAKNQRQQRPTSTQLRSTTSHNENLNSVGARCTDLLTRQLCPTTSRGLPDARSVPNLDVQPLQLGRRPLLVRWLAGWWVDGPGWPLQHGLSFRPTLLPILLLSFIRFDNRFSLERGTIVPLIAETRMRHKQKYTKSKKHSSQSVM